MNRHAEVIPIDRCRRRLADGQRLQRNGRQHHPGGGATTWQSGDGIEIEWEPTGELKRISSKVSHLVGIADRRGVTKVQTIAEEKAKAAVVRFMNQTSASRRVVNEVDTDLSTATQTTDAAGSRLTKETQRTMVESLSETTSSYASGKLSGVIVLEKGYDEQRGEAWTVVGISRKSMGVAAQIKHEMSNPAPYRPQAAQQAPVSGAQALPGEQRPTSEVRRTRQQDW